MTRRQLALAYLTGATGTTNSELAAALGWRRASVRGLLSLLRKEGWNIQSDTKPGNMARVRLHPPIQAQPEQVPQTQETWLQRVGLLDTD